MLLSSLDSDNMLNLFYLSRNSVYIHPNVSDLYVLYDRKKIIKKF